MTKRRWLTVAGLLACLVCVPLVVLAILPDNRPGVTEANFNRIQKGMTLKEVEDIFGKPGLPVLNIIPPVEIFDPVSDVSGRKEIWWLCWNSESDAYAFVTFRDGQVARKAWSLSTETVLEKIYRWLHLDSVVAAKGA